MITLSADSGGSSGFGGSRDANLHIYHADRIGEVRCSWCHVAVPHGWKNKALLVNLNDVGPEAGLPAGTYGVTYTTGTESHVAGSDVIVTSGGPASVSIPGAGALTIFQK